MCYLSHRGIAIFGTCQRIDALALSRHTYCRLKIDDFHQIRVCTYECPQPTPFSEGIVITLLVPFCHTVIAVIVIVIFLIGM